MSSPSKTASIREMLRKAIVRRNGEEFWHAHDLAAAAGLQRIQALDDERSVPSNGLLSRFERLLNRRGLDGDETVAVRSDEGYLVGFDGAELLCTLLATEVAAEHIGVVEAFLDERRNGAKLPPVPDVETDTALELLTELESRLEAVEGSADTSALDALSERVAALDKAVSDNAENATRTAVLATNTVTGLPDLVRDIVRAQLSEALQGMLGGLAAPLDSGDHPVTVTPDPRVETFMDVDDMELPAVEPQKAEPVPVSEPATWTTARLAELHEAVPAVLRVVVRHSGELTVGRIPEKLTMPQRALGWKDAVEALRRENLITVSESRVVYGTDPTGGELFGLGGDTAWWEGFLAEVVEVTEGKDGGVLLADLWALWESVRGDSIPSDPDLATEAIRRTIPATRKRGAHAFANLRWTESGNAERAKLSAPAPAPAPAPAEKVTATPRSVLAEAGMAKPFTVSAPERKDHKAEFTKRCKDNHLNKHERKILSLVFDAKDCVLAYQTMQYKLDSVKMVPTQRAKVPHVLADMTRRGVLFNDPVNKLWSAYRMV